MDLHAALAQMVGQPVTEGLEATFEGPQARGAGFQARPHPGHINLAHMVAKLAFHQRLEHAFVERSAIPAAHPIHSGVLFQRLPAGQVAQIGRDQAKAHHAEEVVAGEGQRGDGGIERVEFAVVIRNRLGPREDDLLTPTQFVDQPQHVTV